MSDQPTPAHPDPQSPPDSSGAGLQGRLRLWPGLALVALFGLVRIWGTTGEMSMFKFFAGIMIGPLVLLVGVLVWWLLASRLHRFDRLLVVGSFVAVTALTLLAADASFRSMALVIYAAPIVACAWWAGWCFPSCSRGRSAGPACSWSSSPRAWAVRCCAFDGISGDFVAKFRWRWTPTPEQKRLAELKSESGLADRRPTDRAHCRTAANSRATGPVSAARNATAACRACGSKPIGASPPRELWRHGVGPGWSSFAVVGDRLFTQEQLGADEYVVCYDATTGARVWAHHDTTRFDELAGGPGPRATPTFHAGRLYSYGANGHLNCFDAASGRLLWGRDVVAKATVPQWGYASSPLVAQGVVVVFAGAPDGKTVAAYDELTGSPAWTAGVGPASEKAALSYCSPQLTTVDGVAQVLLATNAGLSAFQPADGKELWHYPWPVEGVARIVQPGSSATAICCSGPA